MSICYNIVCMDCGEMLSIGKHSATPARDGWPGHEGFAEFNLSPSPDKLPGGEVAIIEHFLARHRLHELRILPDGAVDRYESDFFPANEQWVVMADDRRDVEAFLALPVRDFRPDLEPQELPAKVRDRLAEMSRGERLRDPLQPYDQDPRHE